MRPIEQITDQTFTQAMRCVGYRLPLDPEAKPSTMELCLGLRYGLIGVSAAHHLLLSCPDRDERRLVGYLRNFGSLVEEHVQNEVMPILPFRPDSGFAERIGRFAREPIVSYLPLYRRMCPLELCLSVIAEEFALIHRSTILAGKMLFGRTAARRDFQKISDESFGFALCFFERRQAGLEEVREIALLGE